MYLHRISKLKICQLIPKVCKTILFAPSNEIKITKQMYLFYMHFLPSNVYTTLLSTHSFILMSCDLCARAGIWFEFGVATEYGILAAELHDISMYLWHLSFCFPSPIQLNCEHSCDECFHFQNQYAHQLSINCCPFQGPVTMLCNDTVFLVKE
jgi:hypothetical protein